MNEKIPTISINNFHKNVYRKSILYRMSSLPILQIKHKDDILIKNHEDYIAFAKPNLDNYKKLHKIHKVGKYNQLRTIITQEVYKDELQVGVYEFTEQYHEDNLDWYEFKLKK